VPLLQPRGQSLVSDRQHGMAIAEAAVARLVIKAKLASVKRPSPYAEYVDDPVGFVENVLGDQLWSMQKTIMEAVRDHRRVAVHSAHECSKSHTAARIVSWWIGSHTFGEAFAVTTAPSASQVKTILWREIARAYRAGKLPGRLNLTEWIMDATWQRYATSRGAGNEEIVAFGRKPSDYDPDSFQGIHARHVLAVVDEACGVPELLWAAIGSLAANEGSRVLAIGNPDIASSYFAQICKPDSGWHVIHIDGLMSPNFTDEAADLPDRILEQLIGPTYVRELAQDVGCICEDLVDPLEHDADCAVFTSSVFQSKVRGRFSVDDPQGVVPLSFARQCQIEQDHWEGQEEPVELGMDVGAGGDETVIRERRGVKVGRSWSARTPDWSDAVAKALDAIDLCKPARMKIDVAGIGWGVVGRLRELHSEGRHACQIVPVNVGEKSSNPARFPKLRDQIWWEVGRQLSQDKAWDLRDAGERTIAQLTSPQFTRDSAGRIKIESKDDTRKRIRRSPDDADALLLAFYSAGPAAADVSSEQVESQVAAPQRMTLFRRRAP
jgi:hypothetical protein